MRFGYHSECSAFLIYPKDKSRGDEGYPGSVADVEKRNVFIVGLVLSAASATVGFIYGAAQARQSEPPTEREPPPSYPEAAAAVSEPAVREDEEDDSDDGESIADGDLSAVTAGFLQPCKLVLVVRTDLKMTPGKIAAQ
ncbi:hypothetical protein FA95DRAFT_554537 [Auriscalpium vulgare]|uniref:Uncharacterized protein n=1 Tax=Auriscalpium vulgare TaxID=40419 RepID=A0ACB8S4K4_9AGAM|nr:hypothetical protein FA95DRAFT_554537 [Auriscalpium vulgare]